MVAACVAAEVAWWTLHDLIVEVVNVALSEHVVHVIVVHVVVANESAMHVVMVLGQLIVHSLIVVMVVAVVNSVSSLVAAVGLAGIVLWLIAVLVVAILWHWTVESSLWTG